MKQKTRILTLLFILSTLCVMGCVEDIESEQFHKNDIVVNCILTDDTVQHLSLTYSNELGITLYDEIKEATVSLYDSWGLVGTFEKKSYGEWQLNFRPKVKRKYKLVVEVPGKETVYAETTFPEKLEVYRDEINDTETCRYFKVKSDKAYWIFAFNKLFDTIMYPPVLEDRFVIIDALGTDSRYADDFNVLNVTDFFARKHDVYVRMLPTDGAHRFKLFDLKTCLVVFRSVSEEYDKYHKSSLEKMYVYRAFDDPTQRFDETVVYSNIHNGLGIFGAYNDVLENCNISLPD